MGTLSIRNVPDELMRQINVRSSDIGKTVREFVIERMRETCDRPVGQPPWKNISPLQAKAIIKESKAGARMRSSGTDSGGIPELRPEDDIPTEPSDPPEDATPLSGREILEQESAPHQLIPAWAEDLPEGSEEQKFLVAYLRKRDGVYPSSEKAFRLRFVRGEP